MEFRKLRIDRKHEVIKLMKLLSEFFVILIYWIVIRYIQLKLIRHP